MKPHQKIILKRQTNYDSSKCTAHTKNCKIDFAEFTLNKGNLMRKNFDAKFVSCGA